MTAIQSAARLSEKNRVMGRKEGDDLERKKEYLTMRIDGQLFGLSVLQVQDVLSKQKLTYIPLAPEAVAGALNLRGRIVTSIDMRVRMGFEKSKQEKNMNIVVEHGNELYSLIVDEVGDVMALSENGLEKNPATLQPAWQSISKGIYRLSGDLMIILDVDYLLKSMTPTVTEE